MKTTFEGTYNPIPSDIFESDMDNIVTEQNDAWAKEVQDRIVSRLKCIKVVTTPVSYTVGATTTTFLLRPDDSVRMGRFKRIEDDISIAVGAQCRVVSPFPGTDCVGVEVPTKYRQTVRFGDVCGKGDTTGMELPISMGIRPDGSVLAYDLTKMPHLLVAGATGQGKSVGLNVIITSLLSYKRPWELNLYLVDPKRVEFSCYEPLASTGILKRIDTDMDAAENTLDFLCEEMDRRYKAMQVSGYRKISDWNKAQGLDDRKPYIVCIIDEFADMMMREGGGDVETKIIRIAQLGRAAGVHLIIATQRPDATVITGLIKANFPARIAFRTSTGTDSRIIVDRGGAQLLTGNGDMLMLYNGNMERAQCAFISDAEISEGIDHCLAQLGTMRVTNTPGQEDEEPEIVLSSLEVGFSLNSESPREDFELVAQDEEWSIRVLAAKNRATPTNILDMLAHDKNTEVVSAVADNVMTPVTTLQELRGHDDFWVRVKARITQAIQKCAD